MANSIFDIGLTPNLGLGSNFNIGNNVRIRPGIFGIPPFLPTGTFQVSDFKVQRPNTPMDYMAEEELERLAKKLESLNAPSEADIRTESLASLLGEISVSDDDRAIDDVEINRLLGTDPSTLTPDQRDNLHKLGMYTIGDVKYFRHYRNAQYLISPAGKNGIENKTARALNMLDNGEYNPEEIGGQSISALNGISTGLGSIYADLDITTIEDLANSPLLKKITQYRPGRNVVNGTSRISTLSSAPVGSMKAELIKDKSALISEVTKRINSSPLDYTDKFILSNESIYVYTLFKAIKGDGVKDANGVFSRVMNDGVIRIREYINRKLLTRIIETERIDLEGFKVDDLANKIANIPISYAKGQVKRAVLETINGIDSFGDIEKLVNEFFASGEVSIPSSEKPRIKSIMINYLAEIGLNVGTVNGNVATLLEKYDEYLASAYIFAIKNKGASDDPVKRIFSGGVNTFNYEVNYFDSIETQSIDRENILAAGTLYYIKVLGDEMGLFRIMDSLIMAWTSGRIDIPQGETATRMYNYYKLREDRTTPQERSMFYKIVLNSGEGQVMEGMSVNRNFSAIWERLMEEVVRYIQRFEDSDKSNQVSKSNITQSIKFLQQNLSRHAFGMVKAIIPEVYSHLEEAIAILNSPEIISQLGRGYYDRNSDSNNRNLWDVVERVSMEEFGQIPNTSAMITAAVKGHQIFKGVAQFSEGTFLDSQFREFVDNCESFIIAQSQGTTDSGDGFNNYEEENYEEPEMESMEEEWDF